MRRILFVAVHLLLIPALALSQPQSQVEELSGSIEKDLVEGILPFWMNHTEDPDGGFYGTVMNDGRAVPTEKGAILNARILWTFSRAYRQYGLPVYKEMADQAVISGLPTSSTRALVQVTNAGSNAESQCLPVVDGKVEVFMPAESFVSIFAE